MSFLNTDYQCKLTPFVHQNLSSGDVVDYQDYVHIGQSPKGDWVLCLDGGGIKGLILIDMLITTERKGNKITELFDCIIGTSTGGILALVMVYSELHFPMCKHIIPYKQKYLQRF